MKWLKKLFAWLLVIVVIVLVVVAVVLTLGAIIPAIAAAVTTGWVALGGTAFTWACAETAAVWSATLMMAASVLLPIAAGLMGSLAAPDVNLPAHTTPIAADRAEVEADVGWVTSDRATGGARASITDNSITEVEFVYEATADADATTARPLEDTILTQNAVAALAQAELLARLAQDKVTIDRLQSEIVALEEQLQDAELDAAVREVLEQRVRVLTQAKVDLEALASEQATTIDQQLAELNAMSDRLAEAEDALSAIPGLESRVAELLDQMDAARQTIATLEAQTSLSQREIDDLMAAMTTLRQSRDAIQVELERARDALEQQIASGELKDDALSEAEAELAQLQTELEAITAVNLSLSLDKANMSATIDRLATLLGSTPGSGDLVEALEQYKLAQQALLDASQRQAEQQAQEAARQLAIAQDRFNQLINERDYDQSVIQALSRELQSMESTVGSYADWIESLTGETDTLRGDLEIMQAALADARKQVVTLEGAQVREQRNNRLLLGAAAGAGLIGAFFSTLNNNNKE